MFSRTSRLNQKPVVLRIFRVLHTVQFSRFVVVSQQQLIYLIITHRVCQQLFYLFFEALSNFRAALSDALYLITTSRQCQALF